MTSEPLSLSQCVVRGSQEHFNLPPWYIWAWNLKVSVRPQSSLDTDLPTPKETDYVYNLAALKNLLAESRIPSAAQQLAGRQSHLTHILPALKLHHCSSIWPFFSLADCCSAEGPNQQLVCRCLKIKRKIRQPPKGQSSSREMTTLTQNHQPRGFWSTLSLASTKTNTECPNLTKH